MATVIATRSSIMSGLLKFISPLVHPVGFGWLVLLLAVVVCALRGRRLAALVSGTAAVLIWTVCQPWLAVFLIGNLERPWVHSTIEQAGDADAVIVLGGGWRTSVSDFAALDLTNCGDRLVTGFELCRRRKARHLIVGGDPLEPAPGTTWASERVRWWFTEWKIAPAEFHTLGPVRSTREEALRARELAAKHGWNKFLLVTSATHMRRAVASFERAGLTVEPVACDFQVLRLPDITFGWRWFPDEDSLATFAHWWHEQLGWFAYRLSGHL